MIQHLSARAQSCLALTALVLCRREDTAWAYDVKTSSFLIFGGWASRWLGDLIKLDVSAIIGPPYACTGEHFCSTFTQHVGHAIVCAHVHLQHMQPALLQVAALHSMLTCAPPFCTIATHRHQPHIRPSVWRDRDDHSGSSVSAWQGAGQVREQ